MARRRRDQAGVGDSGEPDPTRNPDTVSNEGGGQQHATHYPYPGPNPYTFEPLPHPTLRYAPPRDDVLEFRDDPFLFCKAYWPDVRFYRKQRLVIESVRDNDETYCYAAHQMGKDFLAGFVVLWKFLCFEPCRVVTTSVKDDHLRVLWGEIGRYVANSRVPLNAKAGGQLVVKHRELRKLVRQPGTDPHLPLVPDPFQYALGMVSEKGEGMAGHHARFTLLVVDEACYDSKTEVLTRDGWKLFADLTGNEQLLTMDPKTRIASYQQPTQVQRVRYTGPMYLYERRGGSFCVTPNHKMLWSKRENPSRNVTTWSDYSLDRIDSIAGVERRVPRRFTWVGVDPGTYTIPHACYGRKTYSPIQVPIREWLEFLGWWCSEGYITFQGHRPVAVGVSQKDTTILHKLARTISRWGMRPKVYNRSSSCLKIHDTRLAHHMIQCGRYCWEKRVPSYVGEMTPELISVFLDAYRDGDGFTKKCGRDILYTSSPGMADDLQILSYKAGRISTVMKRDMVGAKAPNGYARYDGFIVSRSRDHLDSHLKIKKKHLQVIDYDGWVYCATVPDHHTLFVRRDGVCMWCGNSGVDYMVVERASSWAKRTLIIGNPYGGPDSWFRKHCKGGDILAP